MDNKKIGFLFEKTLNVLETHARQK